MNIIDVGFLVRHPFLDGRVLRLIRLPQTWADGMNLRRQKMHTRLQFRNRSQEKQIAEQSRTFEIRRQLTKSECRTNLVEAPVHVTCTPRPPGSRRTRRGNVSVVACGWPEIRGETHHCYRHAPSFGRQERAERQWLRDNHGRLKLGDGAICVFVLKRNRQRGEPLAGLEGVDSRSACHAGETTALNGFLRRSACNERGIVSSGTQRLSKSEHREQKPWTRQRTA
ncbi:MAG: hypothetical protein OXU77_22090 [Gammaproteobacteria bacterium]|nr:hypothetical protein [Gammaproteobacteria bacterium]